MDNNDDGEGASLEMASILVPTARGGGISLTPTPSNEVNSGVEGVDDRASGNLEDQTAV